MRLVQNPVTRLLKKRVEKQTGGVNLIVTLHRKHHLKGRMSGTPLLHDKMLFWGSHGPTQEELVVKRPTGLKVYMTFLVPIIPVASACMKCQVGLLSLEAVMRCDRCIEFTEGFSLLIVVS